MSARPDRLAGRRKFLQVGIALAFAAALPACTPRQSADDSGGLPAVTTAPPDGARPIRFETVPLRVEAADVVAVDPSLLANATWTRKQCALALAGDAVEAVVDTGSPASLSGYFIGPDDRPAGDFDVVLKGAGGNYRIPVRTGWDRSDVAEFFRIPELASSGFAAEADLSGVPAGRYEVDFVVHRQDGDHFCESGKALRLR